MRKLLPLLITVCAFAGAGCAGSDGLFTNHMAMSINTNGNPDPNFFNAPADTVLIVFNSDDIQREINFGSPMNTGATIQPGHSATFHLPSSGSVGFTVVNGGSGSCTIF